MKFFSSLVFLILFFGAYVSYQSLNTPVAKQDFVIHRGETLSQLHQKLSLPIHPFVFKLYTKFFVKNFTLQAGVYSVEKDTTLDDLFVRVLKNPTSKDITITILPGWNIWDIDYSLAKTGLIPSGEFTKLAENISPSLKKRFPFLGQVSTLEGFLMPDTYRINPDEKASVIIEMLLQTFDDRIYRAFDFRSDTSLYETLIFASILEKEEKSSVNKPIVAGILKKRYDEKMAIGADATVCYAYRLTMTECTPTFIGEHIYKKTPYNTRDSRGLPPTPIANPSIETIRATLQSQSSPYYYYLHDDLGFIHYGKTLEDHNRNRKEYLGK